MIDCPAPIDARLLQTTLMANGCYAAGYSPDGTLVLVTNGQHVPTEVSLTELRTKQIMEAAAKAAQRGVAFFPQQDRPASPDVANMHSIADGVNAWRKACDDGRGWAEEPAPPPEVETYD